MTIWHLAPPLPGPKLRAIRPARRVVTSSPFARRAHEGKECWIQIACCWNSSGVCARKGHCPYQHVPDPELFQVVPCQFAGMPEGCHYHREVLRLEGWKLANFQTSAEAEEADFPLPTGSELYPLKQAGVWRLRTAAQIEDEQANEHMGSAAQRFLSGLAYETGDE